MYKFCFMFKVGFTMSISLVILMLSVGGSLFLFNALYGAKNSLILDTISSKASTKLNCVRVVA